MPTFDLYSESTNPTPEQLLALCERFNAEIIDKSPHTGWDSTLKVVQHLAEQILGHYQSLRAVSDELAGLRELDQKLPPDVLAVFIYACAQEHDSLGVMIDEVESLYADGNDQEVGALAKSMWQNTMLSMMPRVQLWDKDGRVKYSPCGFSKIYPEAFRRQTNDWYAKGEVGVKKILDDFSLINDRSRKVLADALCERVYGSVLPPDHPVRALLSDELDMAIESHIRFDKLFVAIENRDEHIGFEARLDHTFSLMHKLPAEQAIGVVNESINRCIKAWMTDLGNGFKGFNDPNLAVSNIIKVLEQARPFGFSALEEVSRHVDYMTHQTLNKPMVEALLDEVCIGNVRYFDSSVAWKKAALTTADEDLYLNLDLDEKYLVMLLKIKGTPGLREALKKTSLGREVVLGHDLGL
ncbi:hypothetical protein [Pseudomonas amygdali]|uniref:Uncharacterized protein n=2 Tax=Pseudomonas amygdali pv. lachrymans TaxID=53707 RepID=A0ABR5KQJ3_PSEAV|nr:hypothetical protein [Pseudomonas amygdali]AXH59586.1 hypothetical protein PLA107_030640 [Pseudomonas amygdali pv. lachrymans str. M301315]KPC17012.1 Uncharacterized protein AC499_0214 [Pseudomonas amygdali pv. lachrymans]KPC17971.1 Uncharacterized protein AC499_1173 [Pseudomonas amygdali pv. lachrymans]RMT06141.1 hypothetical protein ALP54_03507 [Pseudomonas amygdali pv. lachrymans]